MLDFSRDDAPAVALLMQEAERWDHAAEARALAEELGGLPLALVVAGALIKATGEGFAAYAERLGEVLAHVPENEDYPTSLIGAVQLSYDRLEGDDARMVADLCAWWAAEGLEPALLTEAPGGDWWEDSEGRDPRAGAGAGGGCGAGAGGVRRAGRAVADHPRGRRVDDAPADGAGAARLAGRARVRGAGRGGGGAAGGGVSGG